MVEHIFCFNDFYDKIVPKVYCFVTKYTVLLLQKK